MDENTQHTGTQEDNQTHSGIQALAKDYLEGKYNRHMSFTDYLLARTVCLLQGMAATQTDIAQTARGATLATCDIADAVQSMDL